MLSKISVITVVYNAVQTIENTILSVLHQTYPNTLSLTVPAPMERLMSSKNILIVLLGFQNRIKVSMMR